MLETKIEFFSGKSNKKIIIAIGVALILIAVIVIGVLATHRKGKNASLNIMNREYAIANNSILTQLQNDAAKIGQITIIVDNFDSANDSIKNIATQNEGSIQNTFISHVRENTKSGYIIVKIPSVNFDAAFSDLKKIGSRVLLESSEQIPMKKQVVYPQPQPMAESSDSSADAVEKSTDDSSKVSDPTAAPMPIYPQITQDQGYIKVIFADHKENKKRFFNSGSIFGTSNYVGQNMRENIWLILAIKSIFLVTLLAILFVIVKKIIKTLRKKKNQPSVHIVKQAAKVRPRAIRKAKRK